MIFNRKLFAFAVLSVMAILGTSLCAVPFEEGAWKNIDPNTRGITRVDIRFVCQDQIRNGQPYPPGPPFYVHLYGSCSPQDCDWGEVGAVEISNDFLYATYDQGFAKRYVYLRKSQRVQDGLWLYMYTDFTDPSRQDYTMQQWFKK